MNSQKPLYTDLTNVHGYDLTQQIYFDTPHDAFEFMETTGLDFRLKTTGPWPGEYFYSPRPWLLDIHEELTALRARVAELEAGE